MLKIVDLQIKEIIERTQEYGIGLVVEPSARSWLADQGFDPLLGARPLKRAIQQYIVGPLAIEILKNPEKKSYTIDVKKDAFVIS